MPLIEDAEFDPEMAAQPESPEPPSAELSFDPRHRDDFTGLLWLGGLNKTFEWNGHKFEIRTLRTEEIIAVGLSVKDYDGAPSQMKAYATAVVAAALVSVDGKPFETPFREENASENLNYRITKVGTWYPMIIDVIYSEYLSLEERVREIFEEMGKA